MKLLKVQALAQVLGVPRARAYELLRLGTIPSVRIGRSVRVDESVVRNWISSGGRGLTSVREGQDAGGAGADQGDATGLDQ
jgi:excisionase family DNA binding protein